MMQEFFTDNEIKNLKLRFEYIDKKRRYITLYHNRIMKLHEDYHKVKSQGINHWSVYWRTHTMYKK